MPVADSGNRGSRLPAAASPLYRRAALAARNDHAYGSCARLAVPGGRLILLVTLLIAAAAAALLFNGEYAARETVSGVVTTTAANVVLRARQGGTVSAVLVGEGDRVAAGDALLQLDHARHAGGVNLDAALLESLRHQAASLERELDGVNRQRDERAASLAEQQASARAEVVLLERAMLTAERRVELGSSELAALASVVTAGHVARIDYERSEARQLTILQERDTVARQLLAARARLRQIVRDAASDSARFAERAAVIARNRQEIRQRVLAVQAGIGETVVSPLAGRVSALRVRRGDTVAPRAILLTVLPPDSEFRIELHVPDSAIRQVRPGAAVSLRVDAFPYTAFGTLPGRVADVSEAPLVEDGAGARHWRVTVIPGKTARDWHLQAGMAVTADVLRERRRLLQWLLQPAAGAVRRL